MSYYSSKYGSTEITSTPIESGHKIEDLLISWDYWDNEEDPTQRTAVFLYTPYSGETDIHYHISLKQENAARLRDWLNDFLGDCGYSK